MTNFTAHLASRTVLALSGEDRISFLQGLVTNDVKKLNAGQQIYAGMLSPQGKLLYDFFLTLEGDAILIDIAREDADALARRLTMYKLRAKVTIEPREDLHVEAAWGDAPLPGLPDPREAALGTRLVTATLHDANASEADYTAHRLALGIGEAREIGHEATYPLEANFEALHGVDFKKGCYVGQELTARMKFKSALRKRVLPVSLSQGASTGASLIAGEKEIGTLLGTQGASGLALIRLDRLEEAGGAPIQCGGATAQVNWPGWLPR